MFSIKLIVIGTLKESYWRDAVAEYGKRIGAFAHFEIAELREQRLPDAPSPAEIAAALDKEADAILAAVPPRAPLWALCVEGEQCTSEQLAKRLGDVRNGTGTLCLVIGSSHGLSPRVKQAAAWRWGLSRLTFPHQMARVLTAEAIYRGLSILHGGKYHK